MTARHLIPLAAAGALAAGAAPVAAAAPVLDPIKPCYVSVQTVTNIFVSEPVMVGGRDFAPGSLVDVLLDGEVVVAGQAIDAGGVLAPVRVYPPVVLTGSESFQVAVLGQQSVYGPPVTASSRVSALSVRVRPARARPAQRVRFSGRGFTGTGAVYAHYLLRGRLHRTVRLTSIPRGACGTFSVRRAQFPFKPRQGVWTLQVDQHRKLSDDGPLVRLAIDVRRRPAT